MGKLLITTAELQAILSCSYRTAVDIGTKAGAKVQYGRAVRWRVKDIERYLKTTQEVKK